jgi:hypothetical protein
MIMFRSTSRRTCLRAIGLGLAVWVLGAVPAAAARYALLAGCTTYPALDQRSWLVGPKNDALLFRRVLIERYGFAAKDMTVLIDGGENGSPTRENIRKGFVALADRAKPDDLVVILLAGHGSQQPVPASNDWIKNYEPNGQDQVFCPQDVSSLEANRSGRIDHGIVDDEIGEWLQPILAKGAFVWIIIDACHSATMIRGNGAERTRALREEDLVPQELIDKAYQEAKKHPAPRADQVPPLPERLVALYACQTSETEPEGRYPFTAENAEDHGLLTFAVIQSLSQRRGSITYRELAREIHSRYIALNHLGSPTPMLEGRAQDHFVLNESEPGRRVPIQLGFDEKGRLAVNAGAVQGLTAQSVLAVYPPPGDADADKVLGHVKVVKARLADASVEPCAYGDKPLCESLPEHARCEVVYLDCGQDRLTFAVDVRDAADKPLEAALRRTWCDQLRYLANENPRSLVRMVDDPRQAQWLVRLDGASVQLVPGSGWPLASGRSSPPAFRPAAHTANVYQNTKLALETIARATSLVKLASQPRSLLGLQFGEQQLQVQATLKCGREKGLEKDRPGQKIAAGTFTILEIANNSPFDVDVTVFYVDSHYGITSIFPSPETKEYNRLAHEEHREVLGNIEDKTLGNEHFLVAAVRAEPQKSPADLSPLGQEALEEVVTRGRLSATLASRRRGILNPLESLLSGAVDHGVHERGFTPRSSGQFSLEAISFLVVDPKAEAATQRPPLAH